MVFPNNGHFFNGDSLGLRKELVDEDAHHHNTTGKEDEEAEFQMAKHGGEGLRYGEGEDHVDGDVDTLSSGTDFKREDFTGHQPAQGTP